MIASSMYWTLLCTSHRHMQQHRDKRRTPTSASNFGRQHQLQTPTSASNANICFERRRQRRSPIADAITNTTAPIHLTLPPPPLMTSTDVLTSAAATTDAILFVDLGRSGRCHFIRSPWPPWPTPFYTLTVAAAYAIDDLAAAAATAILFVDLHRRLGSTTESSTAKTFLG